MRRGKTYLVPHRRRREMKTDYRGRLRLLKSGKPRLVVRRSLNNLTCQIVKYEPDGDVCVVSAGSHELQKLGWKGSGGNLPAAYLTGLLCGSKAKKAEIKQAVMDTGLYTSTKGSRLYAALKGAIDAGLEIPLSEKALPDEERIKGGHIAAYASRVKQESSDEYKKRFSRYLKARVQPEDLVKHFEELKQKILSKK